jgi:hypothetical protein
MRRVADRDSLMTVEYCAFARRELDRVFGDRADLSSIEPCCGGNAVTVMRKA